VIVLRRRVIGLFIYDRGIGRILSNGWTRGKEIVKGSSGRFARGGVQDAFKAIAFSIPFLAAQCVAGALAVDGPSPDSPTSATVRDLVNNPSQYDGRRLVVSGLIHSITLEQGRRGSEYYVVVLDEPVITPRESRISVTVISDPVPNLRRGQHVTIRGIFHREGNEHGHPYEYFIDAESILRLNST
jgi:hypothetical protein